MWAGSMARMSSTWAIASSSEAASTAHSPLDRACMATPPNCWMPMRTPVNSSTMAGPDTKANASAVITVRSASPRRRAGPESAGPVSTMTTGTTPEHAAKARAARPHPCSEATPSDTSAPLVARTRTMGIRRALAAAAACLIVSPSSRHRAPRRTSEAVRTTMAGRPPSCSMPAWMLPVTRGDGRSERRGPRGSLRPC